MHTNTKQANHMLLCNLSTETQGNIRQLDFKVHLYITLRYPAGCVPCHLIVYWYRHYILTDTEPGEIMAHTMYM